MLALATPALAAPAQLDTSFGTDGVVDRWHPTPLPEDGRCTSILSWATCGSRASLIRPFRQWIVIPGMVSRADAETSSMRRPIALLFALVAVVAIVLAPGVHATPDDEGRFLGATNGARAQRGLPALQVAADLVDVARRHAARMASEDRIYHNPHLRSEVKDWEWLGENVGRGGSVESIHRALMASTAHRDNILSGTFTEIGIGVVWKGQVLYVAQVFRTPKEMQAAAQPAPKPKPAPAPAPAPRPAPPLAPTPPAPAPQAPPAPMAASEPEPAPTPPPPEPVEEPPLELTADVLVGMAATHTVGSASRAAAAEPAPALTLVATATPASSVPVAAVAAACILLLGVGGAHLACWRRRLGC